MKDYSISKSSREALLRKAGFREDHSIFDAVSFRQMIGFHIENDPNDDGTADEGN